MLECIGVQYLEPGSKGNFPHAGLEPPTGDACEAIDIGCKPVGGCYSPEVGLPAEGFLALVSAAFTRSQAAETSFESSF